MPLWTLKRKTILVVDDIAEMRSILRSMLTTYGATEVHLARNGEEAIDHLAARRFDLVMCDYNLGDGRDGQQVLEEARHRALLPRSSVFVMVTAESKADMVMGALEHQPDAYLAKPIPKAVLQPRLQRLFERKERLAPIHAAIDARDHERALELCDATLDASPRHRYALLELRCDLLARLGRHDEVATLCESILDERELPWAALALGKAHFHRGSHERAREAFEDLVEHNASFVVAYDWLARTERVLGDLAAAEGTLRRAVERSPKSLPRQRALAEVAFANGATALAESARRAALRVGHDSVTKRPSDYAELAAVLTHNGKHREALAMIDTMRRDCRGDAGATLEADAAELAVNRALGDDARARELLSGALEALAAAPASASPALALGLLEACLAFGEAGRADEVAGQLVRNHHDDASLLERIAALFAAAGRSRDGERLVSTAREDAARINDEGVELLAAGRVEESVELFSQALKGMPRNPVVNLNAAQSLATAMQEGRVTRRRLAQAMSCLEVVGSADPADARYRRLLGICNQLAAERAS